MCRIYTIIQAYPTRHLCILTLILSYKYSVYSYFLIFRISLRRLLWFFLSRELIIETGFLKLKITTLPTQDVFLLLTQITLNTFIKIPDQYLAFPQMFCKTDPLLIRAFNGHSHTHTHTLLYFVNVNIGTVQLLQS